MQHQNCLSRLSVSMKSSPSVVENNEIIDVKWARYGQENGGSSICSNNEAVRCGDETQSLQKVREACQGEERCTFTVSNGYFGGDPCPTVQKYVNVTYVCAWNSYKITSVVWG